MARPTDEAFAALDPLTRIIRVRRYNDERFGKENVGGADADEAFPSEFEVNDLQSYVNRLAALDMAAADHRLPRADRMASAREWGRSMDRWPGQALNDMYRFEGPGETAGGSARTPDLFRRRDAMVDDLRRYRGSAVRYGVSRPPLGGRDVTPEDNAANVARGARQRRARRKPASKRRGTAAGRRTPKATVRKGRGQPKGAATRRGARRR